MKFYEIEFDQKKFQDDLDKMISELKQLELEQVDSLIGELAGLRGENSNV